MSERIYRLSQVQGVLEFRRKRRAESVIRKMNISSGTSVLDVGCGPDGRSFTDYVPEGVRITGVDVLDEERILYSHTNFTYIKRDARDLSIFGDKEFDVAVSFGMMEHICDRDSLMDMASEIKRVASRWAVIVPWRFALIEPHFKFPFFQLYPERVQLSLTEKLNLHGLAQVVSRDPAHIRNHYQWFSSRQWKEVFHGERVWVSPFLDTIAIGGGDLDCTARTTVANASGSQVR